MANSPNCQRIAQGVARLSAFRLPPRQTPWKSIFSKKFSKIFRRSEGALLLPLSADELRLVAQQPAQRQIPHNNGTPKGRFLEKSKGLIKKNSQASIQRPHQKKKLRETDVEVENLNSQPFWYLN